MKQKINSWCSILKYTIMRKIIFVLLLIGIGFAGCQSSDKVGDMQADSAPVGGADSLKPKDNRKKPIDFEHHSKVEEDGDAFLDTVAIGGLVEVELGKLALQKSTNPQVKKFAEKMVADHSRINSEIKAVASKLEVLVPEEHNRPEVRAHLEALNKYTGNEFDKHYMNMMVKDHTKTLELFRSLSTLSREIKDFAKKNLPILEEHFVMAKQVQAGLK